MKNKLPNVFNLSYEPLGNVTINGIIFTPKFKLDVAVAALKIAQKYCEAGCVEDTHKEGNLSDTIAEALEEIDSPQPDEWLEILRQDAENP
jgi:hypothetical protein